MVRRMLVRATTKNYNQVVAELVALLRKSDDSNAGDVIEKYLASVSPVGAGIGQTMRRSAKSLATLLAYRRLGRGRLRMVLEAIEDHQRGWKDGKPGLGESGSRGQNWRSSTSCRGNGPPHWPLHGGPKRIEIASSTPWQPDAADRKLNSKVSNGPWLGDGGKREGLGPTYVLFLNRELLKKAGDQWTDDAIRARTQELAEVIIQIWPVPPGHRSGFSPDRARDFARRCISRI